MNIRHALAAALAALVSTASVLPASASEVRQEVAWTNGEVHLKGTLFLPDGSSRVPAAIVLHGSGQAGRIRNRGSKIYLNHAEHLSALGVAVLVYDKRGVGESTGSFRGAGFDTLVGDADGGLALLRQHPRIDPTRVGVIAVSQGGWLATMLEEKGARPAFFVMVTAGPPVTPAEQEIFVQRNRLRRAGVTDEETERVLAVVRQSHETFRTDAGWDALASEAANLSARPWHEKTPVPIPSRSETWWKWYASFMDYDPEPVLRRITAPMFVALGSRDELIDSAHAVARLAALPQPSARTVVVYDAGHSLMVDGPDQPDAYWLDLETWLKRHVIN